jgi:single-strand DNA-binding protein
VYVASERPVGGVAAPSARVAAELTPLGQVLLAGRPRVIVGPQRALDGVECAATAVRTIGGPPAAAIAVCAPSVARFRIALTPRYRDNSTGEWKDGDALFLTVNVWRQAAENVAESLIRGSRAIVTGKLRQRSYETKEGEKRTVWCYRKGPASCSQQHHSGHNAPSAATCRRGCRWAPSLRAWPSATAGRSTWPP